ncbi:hypothetical protein [Leptospira santarosai]|uniref:hypothetical protein n=1 Tax=Leptospira santarosai TaxID=28183 RepID=UPI0024AF5F0B|nr:hypothetical protein [Leptospira santarosai]MDI7214580.1 hypothetical protein [Leptospira santarosai]
MAEEICLILDQNSICLNLTKINPRFRIVFRKDRLSKRIQENAFRNRIFENVPKMRIAED